MATLTVRNVSTKVVKSLKALARRNRRSMEQEVRAALEQHVGDRLASSGAAVSDTLFVELAVQRRRPLATFDRNVLKRFPEIAHRPGSLPAA